MIVQFTADIAAVVDFDGWTDAMFDAFGLLCAEFAHRSGVVPNDAQCATMAGVVALRRTGVALDWMLDELFADVVFAPPVVVD